MKKFQAATKNNDGPMVPYYPIVYLCGSTADNLALHREKRGAPWFVSDPVSGYKILTIDATYKGIPVSSGHLSIAQAHECAMLELDLLVSRIGQDRLDKALTRARP